MRTQFTLSCAQCGASFLTSNRKRTLCSAPCRSARMSAFQTGKNWSAEQRAKFSASRKGVSTTLSPAGLAAIRKSAAERVRSPEERARRSAAAMGHSVSDLVRQAVSAAKKGHKRTAHSIAKQAESFRRNWANASPEKRAQRAEYAKQHLAQRYGTGKLGLTKPEQSMAARLTEQGVVYEAQHVIGSFLVDFYLPATNTIIEVNGCYWHGCRPCGFEAHNLRGQARDKRKATYFAKHGYKLITVWEHDLT